jgi:hypothetical protein
VTWARSEDQHDATAIARFLDDGYTDVGDDGRLLDRAGYLAAVA